MIHSSLACGNLTEEQRVAEATVFLSSRTGVSPRVGVILGTGLGGLTCRLRNVTRVPYSEIPHFCRSTALGHAGEWLFGEWEGCPAAVMSGRFHLYEGYGFEEIGRAIRVMAGLGVDTLIVTNAAGGLAPALRVGDLVVIADHVNFAFRNPVRGVRDASPRPPRSPELYDAELREMALQAAREAGVSAASGVYIGVTGPNYETRAEYRFLREIGDVVGMSTVPEVTVARSLGMRVLGISTVTNVCNPDHLETTSGEEVAAAAHEAGSQLCAVLDRVMTTLRSHSLR